MNTSQAASLLVILFFSFSSLQSDVPPPQVSITTQGGFRLVQSNGIPDHTTGRFPSRSNPNPITPKTYTFKMTLHPKMAPQITPSGWSWFGVAINGVPIEPGTQEYWKDDRKSGWTYEAIGGESNLGIDHNMAHVQPNGAYHYHGVPSGIIQKYGGDGKKMTLIGWAADGFPIYSPYGHTDPMDLQSPLRKIKPSYRLKTGDRPKSEAGPNGKYDGNFTQDFEYLAQSGDLDECNGRFGVTPEYPEGIYHYYVSDSFPYISRFWKGTADSSFQKHGPQPGTVPRKPRRPDDLSTH
jgi:YHYH protein